MVSVRLSHTVTSRWTRWQLMSVAGSRSNKYLKREFRWKLSALVVNHKTAANLSKGAQESQVCVQALHVTN